MNLGIDQRVLSALSLLEDHGYEAFCVGGAVRDLLMGRTPTDYDIATNATPERVMNIFPKCIATGIKHGTVTAVEDGLHLEITTYRTDGNYTDGRHPDKVSFAAGIEEDLARRDFTINAIAYSPSRGLVDVWGGTEDIKAGTIRCVGIPFRRFSEDLLRIMRCYRFAATLGFRIEPETEAAALELLPKIGAVSRERIFAELTNMLSGEFVEQCSSFFGCENIGLLSRLSTDKCCRFAAFCLLTHRKPAALAASLKAPGAFSKRAQAVYDIACSGAENIVEIRRQYVCYGQENMLLGAEIRRIILNKSTDEMTAAVRQAAIERLPLSVAELPVGGHDIEAMGISGKDIGRVLEALFDMVLESPPMNNRQALLDAAKKII